LLGNFNKGCQLINPRSLILRKIPLWLLLFALFFHGSITVSASADEVNWQQVAPGIEFYKYTLPDPNNVFVVRMDRSNPDVILESSIAQGKLIDGRETVSGMYTRYDQALNSWSEGNGNPMWGMRNDVIVAINGSYFDLASGVPQGGMVQSGWYAKRFDNLGGWGGFAWKLDRSAFISECLYHSPEKQYVTYPATGVIQEIARVNAPRVTNILVMYTPQYNSRTLNDQSGVEVVVELRQPTMIMPSPAYVSGIVREIYIGEGKTPIPFDSIVLSATAAAADTMLENIQIGSEIRITQEINSLEYDCVTPYTLSWTKTYSSIQGAFFFLKDGQIRDFNDAGAKARNPRSAIAFNDQYIFFIVVDGRDYYHSVGMTINELAKFTRDTLGANWGVAQDGGGSSTMVINNQIVNNTYCNIYSCSGYYTPYNPSGPGNYFDEQGDINSTSSVIYSHAGVERTVANGMLMVLALPAEFSATYMPGQPIVTNSDTQLRLGPGTNYASITTIPAGTQGTIKKQMNNLDGVLAKSSYWWYVDFGNAIGWVPEEVLTNDGGENWFNGLWEVFTIPHYPPGRLFLNLPE
jgi:hypothetical protein